MAGEIRRAGRLSEGVHSARGKVVDMTKREVAPFDMATATRAVVAGGFNQKPVL